MCKSTQSLTHSYEQLFATTDIFQFVERLNDRHLVFSSALIESRSPPEVRVFRVFRGHIKACYWGCKVIEGKIVTRKKRRQNGWCGLCPCLSKKIKLLTLSPQTWSPFTACPVAALASYDGGEHRDLVVRHDHRGCSAPKYSLTVKFSRGF